MVAPEASTASTWPGIVRHMVQLRARTTRGAPSGRGSGHPHVAQNASAVAWLAPVPQAGHVTRATRISTGTPSSPTSRIGGPVLELTPLGQACLEAGHDARDEAVALLEIDEHRAVDVVDREGEEGKGKQVVEQAHQLDAARHQRYPSEQQRNGAGAEEERKQEQARQDLAEEAEVDDQVCEAGEGVVAD